MGVGALVLSVRGSTCRRPRRRPIDVAKAVSRPDMALRLKRSAAVLLAAVVLGGCNQGGSLGQAPLTVSAPGVSQTGTQTVRQRVQQLRADQQALAGGIAKQQEQLNAARNQI